MGSEIAPTSWIVWFNEFEAIILSLFISCLAELYCQAFKKMGEMGIDPSVPEGVVSVFNVDKIKNTA